MGPCFPTGGWFLRGRLNLILFVQLIALLHCYNSYRTHVNYIVAYQSDYYKSERKKIAESLKIFVRCDKILCIDIECDP